MKMQIRELCVIPLCELRVQCIVIRIYTTIRSDMYSTILALRIVTIVIHDCVSTRACIGIELDVIILQCMHPYTVKSP